MQRGAGIPDGRFQGGMGDRGDDPAGDEAIGLERVRKDEISLDSWEFKQASSDFYDASGQLKECQLGRIRRFSHRWIRGVHHRLRR